MKTERKAVEIKSTYVQENTIPAVAQDSTLMIGQKTYGFYNCTPSRSADKRQPKPNSRVISDSVLATIPVNTQPIGGKVWGNRVSNSEEGIVVLSETISKGTGVISSPSKSLGQKLNAEVKDIISPSRVKVTKKNPKTGSPWAVAKKTPNKTKFVRSFSALLYIGEDSEEAVVKANVFQSEKSAREIKKTGKVSKDIETVRIRVVPPKYKYYGIPEKKATKQSLNEAKKEKRIKPKFRADDLAFISDKIGDDDLTILNGSIDDDTLAILRDKIGDDDLAIRAHEHSHAAQHRAHGNVEAIPAKKIQVKGKRKGYSDAPIIPVKRSKPEDKKVTFPATYEHNSMRTIGPEHRIVFDYINEGAEMIYSNYIELFNHVIDREFPTWRMGSKKIEFQLIAYNAYGPPKVTPAEQLAPVSKSLYKFVFGSPSKSKTSDDDMEMVDAPEITTLGL